MILTLLIMVTCAVVLTLYYVRMVYRFLQTYLLKTEKPLILNKPAPTMKENKILKVYRDKYIEAEEKGR